MSKKEIKKPLLSEDSTNAFFTDEKETIKKQEEEKRKNGGRPRKYDNPVKLNLVVDNTLVDNLKSLAYSRQTNLNDLINTLLLNAVDENQKTINEYNKAFLNK